MKENCKHSWGINSGGWGKCSICGEIKDFNGEDGDAPYLVFSFFNGESYRAGDAKDWGHLFGKAT